MTAHVQDRALGLDAERPALSRCVAGDLDAFAEDCWGRQAVLSRGGDLPGSVADLFGPRAVDELVAERGLRTPFLRVAKNGNTLRDSEFTAGGGVGALVADQLSDDRLLRLFADGATMVLQGLHRTWPPVVEFSQALAAELGHPVQVNAYVTPAQSQGFSDHYDVHDVFVMQVQGEKRWKIRPPVHVSPLRDQPWTDRRAAVQQAGLVAPLLDVVLSPGDVLYLPRGFLHSATALGGVSTHLTVGVHTWTRQAVAEELVAEALTLLAADDTSRASLPLGVDVGDPAQMASVVQEVRASLARALGAVPADGVVGRLGRAASVAQRAAPVRPLAQLAAAETLQADSVVALRPHLRARLEPRDGGAALTSRAGGVALVHDEVACVERLLDGAAVSVGELEQHYPAARPLLRRLLLAGVLVTR